MRDLVQLLALALVAFSLALVVLGAVQFLRTRRRSVLLPAAVGAVTLFLLLFSASSFALRLFGTLPIALDLRDLAFSGLLPFAVGVVAVAGAAGMFWLARRRLLLALGLGIAGALVLLLALRVVTTTAQTQSESAENAHPSLQDIGAPDGFRVQEFARDVQEPNALAFDDAGNLYYTELVDGNIVRLRDTNGDGAADEKKIFASDFKNPRGLAWHDGMLYVSSRGQINTLRDTNGDGTADENKVILDQLFSLDIQHSNNGIAFGPDGKLYIAIGGPRVGQLELKGKKYSYQGQGRDEWQFAGVLQADPDGKNLKLFARGLRNPYAIAFDAQGRLFATDNGDETIPVPDGDELNLIEAGEDYGYPYFFGIPPAWSDTHPPIIAFIPHTAPTGLTVYNVPIPTVTTAFPKNYDGNLFTALYWHARPGSRYREVVRIVPEDQDGSTVWNMRDFIDGLDRPVALVVGPDGALYIGDMRGGKADPEAPGVIYRVAYQGQ